MQGYSDDRKRLRVGSWRIIYKYGVDNEIDILFIIDIGMLSSVTVFKSPFESNKSLISSSIDSLFPKYLINHFSFRFIRSAFRRR